MKYAVSALLGIIALLGWFYHSASVELTETKQSLAVAIEANETNVKAIARLERSIDNTNQVVAAWDQDRTTLANIRNTTRQAIKEAMRDETFKAWASAPVPADAWRMLRESIDQNGNCASGSAGCPVDGLPGNSSGGKRDQ